MVGEEGLNVVLVWVGGGDSLYARIGAYKEFFGLGHSRFHLYHTSREHQNSSLLHLLLPPPITNPSLIVVLTFVVNFLLLALADPVNRVPPPPLPTPTPP